MKKRIIALACGVCLLISISGCPCNYYNYSTDSTKTSNNRIINAQPAVAQIVVATSNAVGL